MSRSTILLKEIFTGITLVALTEIKKHPEGLLVRFSSGQNKHFDKIYDYTSKEFIKMCGAAGTITDESVIANTDLGKRLWICVKEVWKDEDNVDFVLFDTIVYQEGTMEPPEMDHNLFCEGKWNNPTSIVRQPIDKQNFIAQQREMIANVERKKAATPDPDNFDIM
jgi:hypothetical protein